MSGAWDVEDNAGVGAWDAGPKGLLQETKKGAREDGDRPIQTESLGGWKLAGKC